MFGFRCVWMVIPYKGSIFYVISILNKTLFGPPCTYTTDMNQARADFRCAPSQWETALLCNDVSHRLGASLETALQAFFTNSLRYPVDLLSCQFESMRRSFEAAINPINLLTLPEMWMSVYSSLVTVENHSYAMEVCCARNTDRNISNPARHFLYSVWLLSFFITPK